MKHLPFLLAAVAMAQPTANGVLTELQNTKIELAQTRLQLLDAQRRQIEDDIRTVLTEACVGIGGKSMADCNVVPPSQQQPRYAVVLKAKEEPKK